MSTIVTRAGKGSPLTHTEVDNNFTNLNTDKYQSGDSASFSSITNTGNLTFTGTSNRITGDFSNSTAANRVAIQNSVTNANTTVGIIPNGTGTTATLGVESDSAYTNSSIGQLTVVGGSDVRIASSSRGSGTNLPLTMYTGGSERLRIDTSGNVGIGTSSPRFKLSIGALGATSTATPDTIDLGGTYSSTAGANTKLRLLWDGSFAYGLGVSAAQLDYVVPSASHVFWTNSTERMRIDSSGNVGIGTSSPTTALDVNGNVKTGNSVDIGLADSNNTIVNIGTGATGNKFALTDYIGDTTYTDFGLRVGRVNDGANGTSRIQHRGTGGLQIGAFDAGSVQFLTQNTERMRIDASGNVGIGTSSPSYPLDVNGTIRGRAVGGGEGGQIDLNNSDNNSVGLTIDVAGADIGRIFNIRNNSTLALGQLGGTGGVVTLHTAASERMRIDSSGNVGIGTSSPSARFVVSNSGAAGFEFNPNASGVAQLETYNRSTSAYVPMSLNGDDIRFRTGSSVTERMRITSGGNVLIGTTATSGNGKFTNALDSATIARFSDASNQLVFSRIQVTNASNNATVDAFRFLDADGNINGAGRVAGHIYLTANGASGANAFSAVYYLLTTSNGTLQATFTAIASQVRGTNPISSVQIADDGAGGAVKITVTYINNSGVVTGGATRVSFVGMLA